MDKTSRQGGRFRKAFGPYSLSFHQELQTLLRLAKMQTIYEAAGGFEGMLRGTCVAREGVGG